MTFLQNTKKHGDEDDRQVKTSTERQQSLIKPKLRMPIHLKEDDLIVALAPLCQKGISEYACASFEQRKTWEDYL